MAKIATDVLRLGNVVIALPGTEVHATDEEIKKYGWTDKVKDAGSASPDGAQATVAPDPNLPAGS